jgi:hypothetical protein
MKRTTGMLTVYGEGKKAGGRAEIKRQAILKKRKILEEGRREMCSLSLWRVVQRSKLMHLDSLIHGLFIT